MRDDVVPVVWPCKTVCLVGLGWEVAEEKDGWFVGPDEDGADEDLKVIHHVLVPVGWVSLDVKWRRQERGRCGRRMEC